MIFYLLKNRLFSNHSIKYLPSQVVKSQWNKISYLSTTYATLKWTLVKGQKSRKCLPKILRESFTSDQCATLKWTWAPLFSVSNRTSIEQWWESQLNLVTTSRYFMRSGISIRIALSVHNLPSMISLIAAMRRRT